VSVYLTDAEFRLLTLLPVNVIDEVEARTPGWLTQQLTVVSSRMDARLAKRYAAPFVAPYPTVVQEWLAHIVSWRCYLKRGVNSLDSEAAEYKAQHDQALKEIEEAANSEVGLFELPLVQSDPDGSGVVRGGPMSYSEQSPYVWTDSQAQVGRDEDSQGGGTVR
jgi:phage gp36-like protein